MAYRKIIVKTVRKNGVAYHAQRRETFAEARVRRREDRILNFRTKSSQKAMVRTSGLNFFTVIFLVLFVLMFFSVASGVDSHITFTSLIESLADSPSIDTSWIKTFNSMRIESDWSVFNFLRDFLNTFVDIISVVLWIITGTAQLIVYIGFIFRVLFLGG